VIWRHGVRAAITPVVTALGIDIGFLLGGAVVVETVFNVPGVGHLAYEGIHNADLPIIQGTAQLGAFFIVMQISSLMSPTHFSTHGSATHESAAGSNGAASDSTSSTALSIKLRRQGPPSRAESGTGGSVALIDLQQVAFDQRRCCDTKGQTG
jgi:Binding-protein-dependent transport system inner membrane component